MLNGPKVIIVLAFAALVSYMVAQGVHPVLSADAIGESTATGVSSAPHLLIVPADIRPLPGGLDNVPMLNSNSPEVVQTEGILVSTLPPHGTSSPWAHLNYAFNGPFGIFAHHISRVDKSDGDLKTLYLGVILVNENKRAVRVDVGAAASYVSQPDAPFVPLPPLVDNDAGNVYAGPGDRVTNDILRGQRQQGWPSCFTIPPHGAYLLAALPIPVKGLTPPLNGRSLLASLRSNGPVYAATAALFARPQSDGTEAAPVLADWLHILKKGQLAGPREKAPTIPGAAGAIVYGRVGGVARGTVWTARLSDPKDRSNRLSIPAPGESVAFAISTAERGTLGTLQVQSAPMIVREPDTAYAAHGNYAIKYDLNLPLSNRSDSNCVVTISLQSPLKKDDNRALAFLAEPSNRVFFRGSVRLDNCVDDKDKITQIKHVVLHQGDQGKPLAELSLGSKSTVDVHLQFIYPPDATPPQVVTLTTQAH